jgi:hypothetical protein
MNDQKNFNENKEFCLDLGISTINALRADAGHLWPKIVGPNKGAAVFYRSPETILEPSWLDVLSQQHGLHVDTVIMFHKKAGYQPYQAHSDVVMAGGKVSKVPCALNWTVSGNGMMSWYQSPPNGDTLVMDPVAKLPLIEHAIVTLVEAHTSLIPHDRLVMVRTDVPHRVCGGSEDRIGVSMRFAAGAHGSWGESVGMIETLMHGWQV